MSSIGRMVHYRPQAYDEFGNPTEDNDECLAGIVTDVNEEDDTLTMLVLDHNAVGANPQYEVAEGTTTNTWHWPEGSPEASSEEPTT